MYDLDINNYDLKILNLFNLNVNFEINDLKMLKIYNKITSR